MHYLSMLSTNSTYKFELSLATQPCDTFNVREVHESFIILYNQNSRDNNMNSKKSYTNTNVTTDMRILLKAWGALQSDVNA